MLSGNYLAWQESLTSTSQLAVDHSARHTVRQLSLRLRALVIGSYFQPYSTAGKNPTFTKPMASTYFYCALCGGPWAWYLDSHEDIGRPKFDYDLAVIKKMDHTWLGKLRAIGDTAQPRYVISFET